MARRLRQGILAERFHFGPGELPALPGQQRTERQVADRHPLELMDLVAELREHPADFAVLPFIEHHLEDGAQFVLRLEVDMLGPGYALGQADSPAQFFQRFRRRHAGDLHEVFLLHAVPGVGEEVCQFAVVGDEDQPLAHPVEPADGKQPLLPRHEIDDARTAIGVEIGRHDPHWLVEHVDHPLRVGESLAVHADLLPQRIDAGAELRHHFAVHLDPSGGDQFLAVPPAPETG